MNQSPTNPEPRSSPIRVAIAADYAEEGWASMDLTAEMMFFYLNNDHSNAVVAEPIRPPYRRRFARLPLAGGRSAAKNADRALNRFWYYPRAARRAQRRNAFDLYHIVDHSYSQLVLSLPEERAIVTCHDLDTFRCVLEPELEPRPRWFRLMAERSLAGFRRARVVVCNSEATRSAIVKHDLASQDRLRLIPVGVHPACSPDADLAVDRRVDDLLGLERRYLDDPPLILHVGTTIPRKRIDILLRVFARIAAERPGARLVKVGGAFTVEQFRLAEELKITNSMIILPFLDREVLSGVYRRVDLVLQPSEAEGFGLPVAEALACGAAVLASDIAALVEVGGDAVYYAPVGDIDKWTESALKILDDRVDQPLLTERKRDRIVRAELFSWSRHVSECVRVYEEVVAGRDERRSERGE